MDSTHGALAMIWVEELVAKVLTLGSSNVTGDYEMLLVSNVVGGASERRLHSNQGKQMRRLSWNHDSRD